MENLIVHKYEVIWKNMIPKIIKSLKEGSVLEINMNRADFELVGNRKNYSFRLEIQKSNVENNIAGSAVARDLARVLIRNSFFLKALDKRTVVLRMDKSFTFKMEII